jgi:hypothetical protein
MVSRLVVACGAVVLASAACSGPPPAASSTAIQEQIPSTPVVITRARAHIVAVAATDWRAEHAAGTCPTVADLKAARNLDALADDVDAWGRPLVVECTATSTTVVSAGPDGTSSTSDDVAPAPVPLSKPLASSDGAPAPPPVSGALMQGDPAAMAMKNFIESQVRPKVNTCVAAAVKSDPRVTGTVTGTIVVATDGTVKKVSLDGGGLPDSVMSCAATAIQAVKFDPAPGSTDRIFHL